MSNYGCCSRINFILKLEFKVNLLVIWEIMALNSAAPFLGEEILYFLVNRQNDNDYWKLTHINRLVGFQILITCSI